MNWVRKIFLRRKANAYENVEVAPVTRRAEPPWAGAPHKIHWQYAVAAELRKIANDIEARQTFCVSTSEELVMGAMQKQYIFRRSPWKEPARA